MNLFQVLIVAVLLCTLPCFADEPEDVRLARSMVEAINERDLDRLNELIAPDLVRHSAATIGVSVTSLEDFKAFLRTDFASVPDSVIKVDVIFGNGDFVAMRAIYTGTQTGAMGPFPASNRRVELPFIGILKFADGKISEMWVEWDNIFMLSQLGHFPQKSDASD